MPEPLRSSGKDRFGFKLSLTSKGKANWFPLGQAGLLTVS